MIKKHFTKLILLIVSTLALSSGAHAQDPLIALATKKIESPTDPSVKTEFTLEDPIYLWRSNSDYGVKQNFSGDRYSGFFLQAGQKTLRAGPISYEDIGFSDGDNFAVIEILPEDMDKAQLKIVDKVVEFFLSLEPKKHQIVIRAGEEVKFTLDTSKGRDDLEEAYEEARYNRIKDNPFPESEMSDEAIEKQMMIAAERGAKRGGVYKNAKALRAYIQHDEWWIERHEISGAITSRYLPGAVIMQDGDKCWYLNEAIYRQQYVGGKFTQKMDMSSTTGSQRIEILCDKVDAVDIEDLSSGSSDSGSKTSSAGDYKPADTSSSSGGGGFLTFIIILAIAGGGVYFLHMKGIIDLSGVISSAKKSAESAKKSAEEAQHKIKEKIDEKKDDDKKDKD